MTLLIMAAGMGSRFGGLKQVEPVGPNGEFIIDYSVYDAIRAGYDKVVIIIKEENYDLFRNTIGKRIESKIEVSYVFQKLDSVPDGVIIPSDRIKPWGTSHAILACKDVIKEPFAVINADDFYGSDPYLKIKNFFEEQNGEDDYAMIGYEAANTMTENGSVKRGVCNKNKEGYLSCLIESSIIKENGRIIATPLDESEKPFEIEPSTLVSMNFWGFKPSIFKYLDEEQTQFFEKNKDNLEKCEFLIPMSMIKLVNEEKISVKVLDTSSKWYGVTYKEDKKGLVDAINKMIDDGIYPNNLWS